MTRIAHLTDFHLLEDSHRSRPRAERARLHYLSFGRPLDAQARRARAVAALAEARAQNPDHLLLTGDLTEDGTHEQFEVLAEVLAESRMAPERVTLVPGNHDAYHDPSGWEKALSGPLARYRATSTELVDLRDTMIAPVSTAFHQSCTRSLGSTTPEDLERLAQVAADGNHGGRAVVVAQHHPPYAYKVPVLQWVDGFRDHQRMSALIARSERLYVLHGHTHRAKDHAVLPHQTPRVFSAEAVVESERPLRMYEARGGELWPLSEEQPGGRAVCALSPA